MSWIIENWAELAAIIGGALGVAMAIAKLTPSPKDDAFLTKLMDFFNLLPKGRTNGKAK